MLGRRSDLGLPASAVAWAFYDLAYSLFTFILVARFLPAWIIDDLGRPDWMVSMTQVVVVAFLLVTMPLAGAVADQFGRRKPLLAGFTILAAGAGALLSVVPSGGSILPVLVVGGTAVAFAQLAFAQYDPLLADVAPSQKHGRVSGMAVALGFVGIILGLAVVAELIVGEGDKQRAFAPAGLLFVVLALPAFALVREHVRPRAASGHATRLAFRQLAQTAQQARRFPRVVRFLAGRLLYSEAIATLSAFFAVYMTRLGGFSEREKNLVIGVSVVAAGAGAVIGGKAVERFGPKRPILIVIPTFAAAVLLSAAVGQPWTVWAASPAAGLALGVVWTADRVFMLRISPRELRGQFFGFFNLANRVASALGPLIVWSGTVWVLHQQTNWLSALGASRVALGGLSLAAFLGWLLIRQVSEEPADAEEPPARDSSRAVDPA